MAIEIFYFATVPEMLFTFILHTKLAMLFPSRVDPLASLVLLYFAANGHSMLFNNKQFGTSHSTPTLSFSFSFYCA